MKAWPCVVPGCEGEMEVGELLCPRHAGFVRPALLREVAAHDEARERGVSGATLRWTLAALDARQEAVQGELAQGGRHAAAG